MADKRASQKRLLIDKTNGRIVALTSGAAFVVMFCLVASYILVGQLNYQNKVIGAKKKALTQLKADIDSRDKLVTQYQQFISTSVNVISGVPGGDGPQDGDNAQIVLDALPSKYDFPALAASLEKILHGRGVRIVSIGGSDDEVAQTNTAAAAPQAIAMPFEISFSGKYAAIQDAIKAFELSIRPIQLQTMQLTGSEKNMTVKLTAQTFYQPEKTLSITKEKIK